MALEAREMLATCSRMIALPCGTQDPSGSNLMPPSYVQIISVAFDTACAAIDGTGSWLKFLFDARTGNALLVTTIHASHNARQEQIGPEDLGCTLQKFRTDVGSMATTAVIRNNAVMFNAAGRAINLGLRGPAGDGTYQLHEIALFAILIQANVAGFIQSRHSLVTLDQVPQRLLASMRRSYPYSVDRNLPWPNDPYICPELAHVLIATSLTETIIDGSCAGCRLQHRGLKRCIKCAKVAYCSRECQVEHWKRTHRDECFDRKSEVEAVSAEAYVDYLNQI
jgi:hypothetical protein